MKERVLFVTQKVDASDSVLGFVVQWIEVLSKRVERVVVFSLGVGKFGLPGNVSVFSLGKERGASKIMQVLRFLRLVVRERKEYDIVLVHMTPVWVVIGAPFFWLFKKRVYLWYTHKEVTWVLRVAHAVVKKVFTASEQSFNIKSEKVRVLGHGIPIERFVRTAGKKKYDAVVVGRLTPIKDQLTLLKALVLLRKRGVECRVNVVGSAGESDGAYERSLHEFVKENGLDSLVNFAGAVPYEEVADKYAEAVLNVNLCPTGGVDKVVLEGVLAGALPVVCNESFLPLLEDYTGVLFFAHGNAESLADQVEKALAVARKGGPQKVLQKRVEEKYGLDAFMDSLVREMQ